MKSGFVLHYGFALLLVTLLVGCGGGGSGNGGSPAPTNRAPNITSSNFTASVVENTGGTVLTVAASDPDGDTLQYSLLGPDVDHFTISATGELRFTAPPNFDLYRDADQDNVFAVSVQVSDGRLNDVVSGNVTIINDREGIAVTRIATGFTDAVDMEWMFSQVFLIASKDGGLLGYSVANGAITELTAGALPAGSELLDVATGNIGGVALPVVRLYRDGRGIHVGNIGAASGENTIAAGDPEGAGGTIEYDLATGYLHAATGDPGGNRAQESNGFGKLFISGGGLDLGIVGRGLRSPRGILIEGTSGLVGDQGGNYAHEVSNFETNRASYNFGWPFFEANTSIRPTTIAGLTGASGLYFYGSGRMQGLGVVLGPRYAGPNQSLQNRLILGDTSGKIFSLADREGGLFENRTLDFAPNAGSIDSVIAIAASSNGIYLILDSDGELFRMVAS